MSPGVDSNVTADEDPAMRRSLSKRSLACLLLLILGVLGTGLPSHSHVGPGDDVGEIVASDHHGHGVVLAEQMDRIPTVSAVSVVPAETTSIPDYPVLIVPADPPSQGDLPHERAPPSTSPRAPPLSV